LRKLSYTSAFAVAVALVDINLSFPVSVFHGDQIQASLFQNADVSDVNIMRLCLQYAPGDDLSAKIGALKAIDSSQPNTCLHLCISDILGAAVIKNLNQTCHGDLRLLTSVFQEIQQTFHKKLASVLPTFEIAYQTMMAECEDLGRDLHNALPEACNFHFNSYDHIFKCREDVENLDLKAMYDEALWKILLDKTQATNLGSFLTDSAILHQYMKISGKEMQDWANIVHRDSDPCGWDRRVHSCIWS
jgi:hypothetical protein